MENVILKVDASFGVEVEVGDDVKAGRLLGIDSKTGRKVFSPIDGVVAECRFDPSGHEFSIVLKTNKQNEKGDDHDG